MKLVTALIVVLLCIILYRYNNVLDLCEIETCPYCYGKTFCKNVSSVNLSYTFCSVVNYYFSVKNVFYARFSGSDVVLKKLGHNSELSGIKTVANGGLNMQDSIVDYVIRDSQNLRVCSKRTAVSLVERFVGLKPENATLDDHLQNVWTMLQVNAEPLILQLLKREDGWPVPKYLGSCGRLIVETNCGQSLLAAAHLTWAERAIIALGLLEMADKFTHAHPDFRFYLTDVSPDNVAFSSELKVAFVDLENVIVNSKDNGGHGGVHRSGDFEEEEGFAFSESDICSSSVSDHNFYAVCKLLLSKTAPWPMTNGGLLHSPPDKLETAELLHYVELCARPAHNVSHFHAYQHIKTILRQLMIYA